MAKGKLALGLDIGSSSVKMVLLKETKRGHELQHFGIAPIPPEAIVDGALMNSTAIVQAIQDLVAAQKIKHREAAISVAGHSVIIKKIQLPAMSQEELDEAIMWEAEQYIPFDIKDVNVDSQILATGVNGDNTMDVLLVAVKKDMINDYTAVVAEAGLVPAIVDVDAFAVQNAYEAAYGLPIDETIVLINCGASVVSINILAGGVTSFTRDITLGGNLFTEEIQKQLNVSYDEAEALKVGGSAGGDADAVVPQEVERVIQGVAEQMAGEIQRSLDFYANPINGRFDKIYLSGGTAKVPSLQRMISDRSGAPVEVFNPFAGLNVDSKRFDLAYLDDVGPMAAVAVGLALRREEV